VEPIIHPTWSDQTRTTSKPTRITSKHKLYQLCQPPILSKSGITCHPGLDWCGTQHPASMVEPHPNRLGLHPIQTQTVPTVPTSNPDKVWSIMPSRPGLVWNPSSTQRRNSYYIPYKHKLCQLCQPPTLTKSGKNMASRRVVCVSTKTVGSAHPTKEPAKLAYPGPDESNSTCNLALSFTKLCQRKL
jgi:hypothetical protein